MTRCFLVTLALLSGLAADAHAITVYVDLALEMDEVVVPVHSLKSIMVKSPVPIRYWTAGNGVDYKPERTNHSHRLSVKVASDPRPGNLVIDAEPWDVALRFDPVDDPDEGASLVKFVLPGESSSSQYLVHKLREVETSPPTTLNWRHGGHHLVADVGCIAWTKKDMYFRFQLHNTSDGITYPISAINVRNQWAEAHKRKIHAPGYRDHNEYKLRPGETLTGAIKVSNANALRSGWQLHLTTPGDAIPATFSWKKEEPRGPLQGRLSLAMRVSGGAALLDHNADTAWTTTAALGGQVRYGVSPHWTIQALVDMARTNQARFVDGGDTRDISQTVGRLMAGALLHTGKRVIPYGQVSIGARMSRQEVSSNGQVDSTTRVGPIMGLGGGLMVNIGQRFVMGAALALVMPLGATDGSVTAEATINLGATLDLGNDW